MGELLKRLTPVSAYRARKTGLWDELKDRVDGALIPSDLDALMIWLDVHELEIPGPWVEEVQELIDVKRAELRAEDIGEIIRERFDFS